MGVYVEKIVSKVEVEWIEGFKSKIKVKT